MEMIEAAYAQAKANYDDARDRINKAEAAVNDAVKHRNSLYDEFNLRDVTQAYEIWLAVRTLEKEGRIPGGHEPRRSQ